MRRRRREGIRRRFAVAACDRSPPRMTTTPFRRARAPLSQGRSPREYETALGRPVGVRRSTVTSKGPWKATIHRQSSVQCRGDSGAAAWTANLWCLRLRWSRHPFNASHLFYQMPEPMTTASLLGVSTGSGKRRMCGRRFRLRRPTPCRARQ
nr:uncharacterized protein LOC127325738 [Lolium perenne]